MIDATSVLWAVLAVLVAAFLWSRYRHSYWSKRGVPTASGRLPFVGHAAPIVLRQTNFAKHFYDLAQEHRDLGYSGIYMWGQHMLLVSDPEMVKQIVCKNFSSFHDRGAPTSENDPLSLTLFNLKGTKWRNLRNRLSPTFTSGKLKLMFPLMRDIGDQLSAELARQAKQAGGEVDVHELLSRFGVDVIGSVAFGVNCNSLENENAEFLKMSRDVFRVTPAQIARMMLEAIHPKLGQLLPIWLVFNKVHAFFMGLMRDTVQFREKSEAVRNDFVHLMMQLRDQDRAQQDPDNHMEMTPGVMAAQAFVFFIAGLDTLSGSVAFCLHQMAQDKDLQRRLADEVSSVLQKHGGQLTYEALKEMDLLHRVLLEGLRVWGPIGFMMRKCNETTMVGDVLVEKDTAVMIATDVMHKNPAIFPEPDRFDPDRHTAEAVEQRHPYSFMPFGEGPRMCIAERFAMLEMKLALAVLVRDFQFSCGPRFEVHPKLDPISFLPRPVNGFPLRVEVRQ